jgi:NAD(P)-dependent dehydrogenase (short-subunit alcohol dehydrogenase family)
MDLQLAGKTALVTGATAGIGLAIAARLAAEGAAVVVCGRDAGKLDAAAARISHGARGVLADPASAAGAAALVQAVPVVDILVNNLGIYESKPFAEITDQDWHRFFETNVLSGARLARCYLPAMLERNWGRVVFIASDSALVVPPDMIHYGMTKTAQLAISRGLAGLTRGTGVTLNAVLPGTTRSAGIEDFLRSVAEDPDAPPAQMEAAFFGKERPTSLIQRMIEPEEVASLVAYVASPLSAATNGAALRADGGIVPTIA